jgi:uncharacterized protein YndB with AHSA1/START domain
MQATDSAVRREITVSAGQERAFEVFTAGFDSWWPRSHHIGGAEMATAVIDPEAGEWYEIGTDGSRCEWGKILAYEPPARIVLEWRIGGDWQPDAVASEIEVTFPEGRVVLEHRGLEKHNAAEALYGAIDGEGGWDGLLAAYSAAL